MNRIVTSMVLSAAVLGLTGAPADAAGVPPGNGLVEEIVDCTGGLSGVALHSNGLAVWIDGTKWLVTTFSSDAVSWSNRANGAGNGRTETCTTGDGAQITLVELRPSGAEDLRR